MGKDLYNQSNYAKCLYHTASDILEFELQDISFRGPENKLNQTQFTQPAIFVHSIIVDKLLKDKDIKPDSVAGHSLGEFTALASANVLSFEDALKIIKVRSTAMANTGKQSPGTMAAILGADDPTGKGTCPGRLPPTVEGTACVAASAPAPSISSGPWMQSTGQTSTHAVSQVLTHGSAIIYVILTPS